MNKSKVVHAVVAKSFYNGSEVLAEMLIYRHPPKTIKVEKDVEYGKNNRERMNLLYQKDRTKKQPLMVYIHGGGWISGGIDMRNTYCAEYAKQGFFVANIDYEYAPKQVFPYQIQQCLTAIDKIYSLADKYNFDTSKILLAGESAGGYFITYLAALAADHTLYKKIGLKFDHIDDFKVEALVSICGAFDIKRLATSKFPDMQFMIESFSNIPRNEIANPLNADRVKLLSPVITEGFPPTMIIYATHDELRFESYALQEQLINLGISYSTFKCTGIIALHAWAIATCISKGRECLDKTLDFILPYFDLTKKPLTKEKSNDKKPDVKDATN
ncbi:MAG: alpha/beta hydrolase [Clostridia bacterium]